MALSTTVSSRIAHRAALAARNLVLRRAERLRDHRLEVRLPDGSSRTFGPPGAAHSASLSVHDESFFTRLLLQGETGFGEAYVDGLWETDDLVALLTLGAHERPNLGINALGTGVIARLLDQRRHRHRRPALGVSKSNAEAHYDLGNDLYRLFLDPSMTYSCAVFETEDQPLEQAQRHKHERIARKARLTAADHALDIGCGWGAFAIYAASTFGCRVTGVTLSSEQLALARERVSEAGLDDRVSLQLCDYREVRGKFDKVVSIGMFEHVGAAYWSQFFEACDRLLGLGGRLVLQTISVPERGLEEHLKGVAWLQKHIFPGGALPSVAALERALTPTRLALWDVDDISPHYVRTLQHWRSRFLANLPAVRALGYDERFIRTWDYYLSFSSAGFATGYMSDVQATFGRPDERTLI